MKAPLRPFEYMAWAMSVPRGAQFDLTRSGIADTATAGNGDELEHWSGDLPTPRLASREEAVRARAALTDCVAARYGVEPSSVAVTLGASQAIMQVLIALIRAGDHVIVERPTYEPLRRAPEILGAQVSRLERTFDEGWAVVPDRLAQLLTPRTRAVILSNLHNPSGVGIEASTLAEIAGLAARVGALVLVDEVYLDYGFSTAPDAALRPACLVADNTVSWSSTTKAFGFSALRAGWVVSADNDALQAIRAASAYLHVMPPVGTTVLGRRVLERADALQAHAADVASAGMDVVNRWLQTESRVTWVPPPFGLSGALKLPAFIQDGPFSDHLREHYSTQIVPGTMFEAPGYVRLSFGLPPADLEQALAHISTTLDDLA